MEAYGDVRGFELAREREDNFEQSWQPKRNSMKPLNLTEKQRRSAIVEYEVNKFVLYLDGVFMSNYFFIEDLLEDLDLNKIPMARYTPMAQSKFRASQRKV